MSKDAAGMQTIATAALVGFGWGVGYFATGNHEWGWRIATLAALVVVAVAVRLRNEVTGP